MSVNKTIDLEQVKQFANFALTESEESFFITNLTKYLNNIALIKNFPFEKYNEYLMPSFDEKITINFSDLKDDDVDDNLAKPELFRNCINFVEGYVILKNEK